MSEHSTTGGSRVSNEAFWWSLFSAGGVLAALFVPAFILVSGFLLPTADPQVGAGRYEQVRGVVAGWPVRIVLFLVICLALFHCAHRVRHTLMDLGLRRAERLLMTMCYGGALAGTIVAAITLTKL